MTHASASSPIARPAHYRLSTETWALILKEYREGATAPFLARKWRVSEHAVRARITRHKATKRDWGDEQAIGQALAREAELEEARRNSPEAIAARLFDGIAADEVDGAVDPASLARTATLASGRAMRGRLWAEAKALAGLAESYARLGEKRERAQLGPDDIPVALLAEILLDRDRAFAERMWVNGEDDPDRDLKVAYQQERYARTRPTELWVEDLQRMRWAAEKRVRELEQEAGVPPESAWVMPDFAAIRAETEAGQAARLAAGG